jgi:hypothetical protein
MDRKPIYLDDWTAHVILGALAVADDEEVDGITIPDREDRTPAQRHDDWTQIERLIEAATKDLRAQLLKAFPEICSFYRQSCS